MEVQTHHFKKAFEKTLKFEGVYSDHKQDSGGKTKFGITELVARHAGYNGEMKDLTKRDAESIYISRYWHPSNLNRVASVSPEIAEEVFDTGVNMGPDRSRKILQRALNLFNRNEKNFKNLVVDGSIGAKTIEAISYVHGKGDVPKVLQVLNILQGYKYIEFAERNESQEVFIRGWLKRATV